MEANIIATGFRISEEMYGLRYTELIGDGDSSTYAPLFHPMEEMLTKLENKKFSKGLLCTLRMWWSY